MTIKTTLAAIVALAGVAAPAAAQTAYPPTAYPQSYGYQQPGYGYQQPGYGYQQPGYGYQQGYAQDPISQVIDSLLGNRYQANDRQAVSRCANAVMNQARVQYRYDYGQQGYGYGQRGYQQNIAAPSMRVTAITSVERRSSGLRVSGLLDSGRYGYAQGYGNQQGYGQNYYNQQYGNRTGDLNFRCDVDYRGAVTNIRIRQNSRRY